MPKKREVREKRAICNNGYMEYMDAALYPLYDSPRGPRADQKQESTIIQKNLNDKNSKRLFHQRALANFGPDDLFLGLPYNDEFLPDTLDAAEREAYNFVRRYNYLRKGLGLPPAKFMMVTECTVRQTGKRKGALNYHHHMILSGGVDRDIVESLWSRPRRKGEKEGKRLGYANSKRLQFDENGLEQLMEYILGNGKQEAQQELSATRSKGKRRWKGSKNLADPRRPKPNDTKWSDKQVSYLANQIQDTGQTDPAYWEKKYPGYRFSKASAEQNTVTGRWSIYLRMHRRL